MHCTALHWSLAPVAAVCRPVLNPPPTPIPSPWAYTRRRWSRLYAHRRRRRCISSLSSASLPVLSIHGRRTHARTAGICSPHAPPQPHSSAPFSPLSSGAVTQRCVSLLQSEATHYCTTTLHAPLPDGGAVGKAGRRREMSDTPVPSSSPSIDGGEGWEGIHVAHLSSVHVRVRRRGGDSEGRLLHRGGRAARYLPSGG